MVTFKPYGPYDIPVEKLAASRFIVEDLSEFWEKLGDISSCAGCYVFSIKTGRAVVPFYVGMTLNTFEGECFTDHKLKHYHRAIGAYSRGKPVMSFVVHPTQRGRVNAKAIDELENFLIQAGMAVNPELRNIRGRSEPQWAIKGVMRTGPGAKSEEAKMFAKMMGIDL
ncbi:hypothetical protein C4565_09410 [Candidatus Parcubacteria bacterium]|jgi:hypothetical protein|nr:MAG: hypothetical protein C4565_09410 [Candidatus Parcubacteria bacterium]